MAGGDKPVVTLDDAIIAFHNNPSEEIVVTFYEILTEAHKNDSITTDTYNRYCEEIFMFIIITDPVCK